MRMRVGRVMVAVVAVGGLIGGCGGPDQAGAAVIIDGNVVPLETVQSQLDTALSRPERWPRSPRRAVDRPTWRAAWSAAGDPRPAAAAGRRPRASPSPMRRSTQRLAESGGAQAVLDSSFYDLPALRDRIRDDLIATELAGERSAGCRSPPTWSRPPPGRRRANRAAAGRRRPGRGGAVRRPADRGQGHRLPGGHLAGGGRHRAVRHAGRQGGQLPARPAAEHLDRLQGHRPAHRRPVRPGGDERISQSQQVAIGERLLQPVAERLGVRVNPRYGVWDPIKLRVVGRGPAARQDPAAGRPRPRLTGCRARWSCCRRGVRALPAAAVPALRAAAVGARRRDRARAIGVERAAARRRRRSASRRCC